MSTSSSFVLVQWIGDPKPQCWEVLKGEKFLKPENIKEGATLDAYWNSEETGPAKVLKVHGKFNMVIKVDYLFS